MALGKAESSRDLARFRAQDARTHLRAAARARCAIAPQSGMRAGNEECESKAGLSAPRHIRGAQSHSTDFENLVNGYRGFATRSQCIYESRRASPLALVLPP